MQLDPALADALAHVALDNVATAYPYKLDQVLGSDADIQAPRSLHPAFWGSYDWHSCVHMHWTLARLLQRVPRHAGAAATRAHFDARLNDRTIAGELATLGGPHRASFERPYGWGWLLALAAEIERLAATEDAARRWRNALRPMADAFADRFVQYLSRAEYPTRAGTHGNSAFALILALDWCDAVQHRALRRAIAVQANRWYGNDRRYPAAYEPGGDDFLAAGLVEAMLMMQVVDGCSFADWWQQFVPSDEDLANWMKPVGVSDGTDAKIVHLHGVNLTRAWAWRRLLPEVEPRHRAAVERAIAQHLAVSLPAATRGDYVGTHWLASFALLALGA